jgi:hypothetical protein
MRVVVSLATGLALTAPSMHSLGQGCVSWSSRFGPEPLGFAGEVRALVTADDGAGPRLFVGGAFNRVDGVSTSGPIAWNGVVFEPPNSMLGPVDALALVDLDGPGPGQASLVATTGRQVWRRTGLAWSSLGQPPARTLRGLLAWDDGGGTALYTCGDLNRSGWTLGGVWRLAQGRWERVGDDLFVESFIGPPSGLVSGLAVLDSDGPGPTPPRLHASGRFTRAGAAPALGLARWNGSSWEAAGPELRLGIGPAGDVRMIPAERPGSVYVFGAFDSVDGIASNGIIRWDGLEWQPLGPPQPALLPQAADIHDDGSGPRLLVASDSGSRWNVWRWDAPAWLPLAPQGFDGPVRALATGVLEGQRRLFIGGNFSQANGVPARSLAVWGEPCVPPRVAVQPADAVVSFPGPAVFEVVAQGPGPVAYQWRRDGLPLTDGLGVAGATTRRLTLTPPASAVAGAIDCVISNSYGSVVSRTAVVRFVDPTGNPNPLRGVPVLRSTDPLGPSGQPLGSNFILIPSDGEEVAFTSPSAWGVYSGGRWRTVASAGMAAPGLPEGSRFQSFPAVSRVGNRWGHFLFPAQTGANPGSTQQSWWGSFGAGPRLLGGDSLPAPGLGTNARWSWFFPHLLTDAGEVFVDGKAWLVNQSQTVGLFVWSPFTALVRPFMRLGDPAPHTPWFFSSSSACQFALSDRALFVTQFTLEPRWGPLGWGLYASGAGGLDLLLHTVEPVPGLPPAGSVRGIIQALPVNERDTIVTLEFQPASGSNIDHRTFLLSGGQARRVFAASGQVFEFGSGSIELGGVFGTVMNRMGRAFVSAETRDFGGTSLTVLLTIDAQHRVAPVQVSSVQGPHTLAFGEGEDVIFNGDGGVYGWRPDTGAFPIAVTGQFASFPGVASTIVQNAALPQGVRTGPPGWTTLTTAVLLAPNAVQNGSVLTRLELADGTALAVPISFDRALGEFVRCPRVLEPPSDARLRVGQRLTVRARVVGRDPTELEWRRDGVPLVNGGPVSGADAGTLIIDPVGPEHAGVYTLGAQNACGSAASAPARVEVFCAGDWDFSGSADFNDLLDFLNAFNARDPQADLTRDGVIDFNDLLAMLDAMNGC